MSSKTEGLAQLKEYLNQDSYDPVKASRMVNNLGHEADQLVYEKVKSSYKNKHFRACYMTPSGEDKELEFKR